MAIQLQMAQQDLHFQTFKNENAKTPAEQIRAYYKAKGRVGVKPARSKASPP